MLNIVAQAVDRHRSLNKLTAYPHYQEYLTCESDIQLDQGGWRANTHRTWLFEENAIDYTNTPQRGHRSDSSLHVSHLGRSLTAATTKFIVLVMK